MNTRAILFTILLIVAVAGGYALSKYQRGATMSAQGGEVEEETAHLIDKTIKEQGKNYSINLKYPLFGVTTIDAAVSAKMDAIIEEFRGYVSDDAEAMRPQELSSVYDSTYIDPDIVSGRLAVSSDLGGVHPLIAVHGLNFYRDGRELTLSDALRLTGLTLAEVAARSQNVLSEELGAAYFPDGAIPTEQNYSTFIVNADSVTFIFQEYQVGPYAAGPQEVSFPRKK